MMLAHLAAQGTRGDVPGRERAKLGLVRRLYEQGYTRERVLSLVRFIEWLLALPEEREQALRDLVRRAIARRFGSVPPSLEARIAAADSATLTALFDQVLVVDTLEQI
jgi:hypothetical protein